MNKSSNLIESIKKVCDMGSFIELNQNAGDSCVTGYGTVKSKLVYLIFQEKSILSKANAKKIVNTYEMAIKMGAPIIFNIDNNGVDINDAISSLYLYGDILKIQSQVSGVIPQIAVISGNCGGGMNLIANACDFVFVEKNDGKIWTVPPVALAGNLNNDKSKSDAVKETQIIDAVLPLDEIYTKVRELIDLLPSNYLDNDSYDECNDDINRKTTNIKNLEIHDYIKQIADDNYMFELKQSFSKGSLTAFIRLNGQTIAVLANRQKEKKLCKCAMIKFIKFIKFADAFSIPILTIADVDKFKIENNNEADLSVYASRLAFSYVNATVPKITIIKNANSVPGVVMGSKSLGIDLVYAYNDSKIKSMDDKMLASMLYEDEIKNSSDKEGLLNEKIDEISKKNTSLELAKKMIIDDVIEVEDTRQLVIAGFEMLFTKKLEKVQKKHGAF